jgi:ATP-binding cassette subfamily D (ALD) protein 2
MVIIAIPILTSTLAQPAGDEGRSVSLRTEYYSTAKNLLTSGADAMERLMTAYKVCKHLTSIYAC